MKLLTSTAALSILGPDHTFKTSVVSPKRGQIILVGGGDPYLARKAGADYPKRATINGLARATANRLKQDKIKKVSLGYDSSLFKGPAWNPRWPAYYSDSVSRTSALWVDEGPIGFGSPGPRPRDPPSKRPPPLQTLCPSRGSPLQQPGGRKRRNRRRSSPGSRRCRWSGSWST